MTAVSTMDILAAMQLEDWLKENEVSVPDFAKKIGVKGVRSVYRYINNERIPEKEVMGRILEATKGEVTANSFYEQR